MTLSERQRRVHFLPEHDGVMEIEKKEEYTEQETLDTWFTPIELLKMAMRGYKEALKIEAGKSSYGDYIRGLEGCTKAGKELRETTIRLYIDAAMDEQETQWSKGKDDYDQLALVCQEASSSSVTLALERANEDEREAQKMYQIMQTTSIIQNTHNESAEDELIQHSKRLLVSKPSSSSEVMDDLTSICSDLSLSEISSKPSSDETMENSTRTDQSQILPQEDQNQEEKQESAQSFTDGETTSTIAKDDVETTTTCAQHQRYVDASLGMEGLMLVLLSFLLFLLLYQVLLGTSSINGCWNLFSEVRHTCLEVVSRILLYPMSSVL